MRKPVVYYQYDEAAFRAEQYAKGYFDYRENGFGEVVETQDALLNNLQHILDNDLRPDEKYLNRMNTFFKFNDQNNCKRVYEAICEL